MPKKTDDKPKVSSSETTRRETPAEARESVGKPPAKQPAVEQRETMPQITEEGAARHPDAPDDSGAPMVYDARGDAHRVGVEPDHSPEANRPDGSTMPRVVDPLLSPDAQQPGESVEDYQRRRAEAGA